MTPSGISAPVLELILNDARLADCGAPIQRKLPARSGATLPEKGASRLLSTAVPVGNGDPASAAKLPSTVLTLYPEIVLSAALTAYRKCPGVTPMASGLFPAGEGRSRNWRKCSRAPVDGESRDLPGSRQRDV